MDMSDTMAVKLCELAVSQPDMPNAAARVGAWIVGHAHRNGGFPVELTFRQIQAATGCHNDTIRNSVQWLVEAGLFTTEDGARSRGPHRAVRFLGVNQ
jgi:hypothetical protein